MKKHSKTINFLDLFAGAGGLSEGFIRAGFEPVAHVEMDPSACFTLKTRAAYHYLHNAGKISVYKNYLEGKMTRDSLYEFANILKPNLFDSILNIEISDKTMCDIFASIDFVKKNKNIDLIIGGPPCQAYSLIGRACSAKGMKGDKRNYLYEYYARFLEKYGPRYFVFENVLGLLSAKDGDGKKYFDKMQALFRKNGYETEYRILSAKDYGVLQDRKRVILIGKKGVGRNFYPEPEKMNFNAMVSEAFDDLPFLKAGEGSVSPCKMKRPKGRWLYNARIKNDVLPVTWHQARPNNKQDLEIYKRVVKKWDSCHSRLDYNDLPQKLKALD